MYLTGKNCSPDGGCAQCREPQDPFPPVPPPLCLGYTEHLKALSAQLLWCWQELIPASIGTIHSQHSQITLGDSRLWAGAGGGGAGICRDRTGLGTCRHTAG